MFVCVCVFKSGSLFNGLSFCPACFEVEIDGHLVFSKLESGGFPYEEDVSMTKRQNVLQRVLFFLFVLQCLKNPFFILLLNMQIQ